MCRAMSEGWGDFSALMLIAREGDNLDGRVSRSASTRRRATAPTRATSASAARPTARTTRSTICRSVTWRTASRCRRRIRSSRRGDNAEVHNAGEIWAAALWEGYVALQQAGTSFDAVRAKMAKYVVEGLAMTPTEATPMEARDAILVGRRSGGPRRSCSPRSRVVALAAARCRRRETAATSSACTRA